jgi:DNA-binding IclR family transcriptional regulator
MRSVDNALRLLLLFQDTPTVRITDVSERLGVGVSTAHRLMAALAYRGFVRQDPESRAYEAGPALIATGFATVGRLDIRSILKPSMESVCASLGETIQLMELVGSKVRFIGSVESARTLRTTSRIGVMLPAHCSSGGKALLAELTSAQLDALYPDDEIPPETSRSISTREELDTELESVRQRGFATAEGEGEVDVAAVGVVLRDAAGRIPAAIAASGPRSRVNRSSIPRFARELRQVASEATAHHV